MQRPVGIALGAVFFAFLIARVVAPADVPVDHLSGEAATAQSRTAMHTAREGATTVIRRDSSGQFFLTAQINDHDVRFLIDTGADTVVLTVADAEAVGLDFNPSSFEPISRTASGVGYGAMVPIERLQVGHDEFSDLDAVVMEGLDTNLLGQSVLAKLGRVEMRGDTMVLHHE